MESGVQQAGVLEEARAVLIRHPFLDELFCFVYDKSDPLNLGERAKRFADLPCVQKLTRDH